MNSRRTVAAVLAAVLVGWFTFTGLRTMDSVGAAQQRRAAQIEALVR